MGRILLRIIAIPLEIARALMIALMQIACIATHRNASRVFAILWFLGFIGAIHQTPDWGINFPVFSVQFLIVGGVTMLILNALHGKFLRSLQKMQARPWWRLKPKVPAFQKDVATIVMPICGQSGETRERAVKRLAPELQAMLAGGK